MTEEGAAQASAYANGTLAGRRAIVTGAARGIGRAIATALHDAGAAVAFADVDECGLEAMAADLPGGRVMTTVCDVTSEEAVEELVRKTRDSFGGVDILVNNAGVLFTGLLTQTPDSEWARVLDVNTTGVFRMVRAVLPAMVSSGWGRIISLASDHPDQRRGTHDSLRRVEGSDHRTDQIALARGGTSRSDGQRHRSGIHPHRSDRDGLHRRAWSGHQIPDHGARLRDSGRHRWCCRLSGF